jgi:hypothetical protein
MLPTPPFLSATFALDENYEELSLEQGNCPHILSISDNAPNRKLSEIEVNP